MARRVEALRRCLGGWSWTRTHVGRDGLGHDATSVRVVFPFRCWFPAQHFVGGCEGAVYCVLAGLPVSSLFPHASNVVARPLTYDGVVWYDDHDPQHVMHLPLLARTPMFPPPTSFFLYIFSLDADSTIPSGNDWISLFIFNSSNLQHVSMLHIGLGGLGAFQCGFFQEMHTVYNHPLQWASIISFCCVMRFCVITLHASNVCL